MVPTRDVALASPRPVEMECSGGGIRRSLCVVGSDVREVSLVTRPDAAVEYGPAIAKDTAVWIPGKSETRPKVVEVAIDLDDGIDWGKRVVYVDGWVLHGVLRQREIVVPQPHVYCEVRRYLDIVLSKGGTLPGMWIDSCGVERLSGLARSSQITVQEVIQE